MGNKTILVENMSAHDQEFEVHGWNGNRNLNVKAHTTAKIAAPDGSSGAIIALHQGHEGEQAEIKKDGFGGNDFIDLSNIVGAGGNMTVQQVGDNNTRKGDPQFMQHLNEAWKKASQQTRDGLKNCVFVENGRVVRIGPIKDFPKLEAFVRTFADGKTYIGVGAWGGSPGNGHDNAQSSAAHGNKDVLVTYNDGDATPNHDSPLHTAAIVTKQPLDIHAAPKISSLSSSSSSSTANNQPHPHLTRLAAAAPQPQAAPKDPGPGITLTNKSSRQTTYYFYDNFWNGNGTAGANFDHPLKSITLKPNETQHVPLPTTFKGRVQRGTQLPCTWVEFQIEASNDHAAHGDVSLQQGCDGAATIASTDPGRPVVSNGFDFDVLAKAPAGAIRKKADGERALDTTVGNWMGGPNKVAIEYLERVVGQRRAYIVGGTGVPDVASRNRRLAVVMY